MKNTKEKLDVICEELRQAQLQIQERDQEEFPLFAIEDMVWLKKRRQRKVENPNIQSKFLGPYRVMEVFLNHTYGIEAQWNRLIQNACCFKLYRASHVGMGRASCAI